MASIEGAWKARNKYIILGLVMATSVVLGNYSFWFVTVALSQTLKVCQSMVHR
jgi:hypothetical protein